MSHNLESDEPGSLSSLKDTKTILLTTYKRDGTPIATPISIALRWRAGLLPFVGQGMEDQAPAQQPERRNRSLHASGQANWQYGVCARNTLVE